MLFKLTRFFVFLFFLLLGNLVVDTQRPWVKLGTSTWRTSSLDISVLIKFAKPVFNFSSSAVQVSGGNVLRQDYILL